LEFEPLHWEQALSDLGSALRRADPTGIVFLGGNLSTHLAEIVSRFMAGLGAPDPVFYSLTQELDGQVALVKGSAELLGAATLPYYDIAGAEVLFSFGANLLETWLSPVSQSRAYGQMRRQGLGKRGYFVQFEARMSSTAASADEWIAVRPGTEGAVALALGKMVSDMTGRHQDWYAAVDPTGMADASGVALEELERLAGLFARHERALAIAGGAPVGQHNGGSALAAIHALNLLAKNLGQPGGVTLPGASSPTGASFAQAKTLVEKMRAGKVQVLLMHSCDPAFEFPSGLDFAGALDAVPLVVSFNSTVNDTGALADMILPDHTNLEAWGYQVPLAADRPVISGLQPVMRPLYDTRATGDIFLALARELMPLNSELPWGNEVDLLEERAAETGVDWAQWRRQGGWWATGEMARSIPIPPDAAPNLKLQLPVYQGEASEYHYHLVLYPSITLADGRGANKSWLQETPDPMTTVAWQSWIEVHPETARELELENDDVVRVSSPTGSIEAVVYLYHGIARDVVAMPVGRGHKHYGRFASGFGSNPMQLLVPTVVEETGALAWGATRVKIEKTGESRKLPRLESVEGVEYLRGGGDEH
jgi:anaerobic selenocysteine-containing dehydrogenase